jgi:hypothetical protein
LCPRLALVGLGCAKEALPLDPHEKNAVLIAATLPGAIYGLLHRLLFRYTPPGGCEVTMPIDAIEGSASTIRRHLHRLAELDYIEIIQNGAAWIDGRFYQRPNTYRVLTVAERHDRQRAREVERQAEVELLTVSIACQNDSLDSPEVRIPSACTAAAREAALGHNARNAQI